MSRASAQQASSGRSAGPAPARDGIFTPAEPPYALIVITSDQTAETLGAEFLRMRPQLYRYLRARGAGEAAEDLLQELWLKLSALSGDTEVSDPASYLFRMAHNLMLDRRRTDFRRSGRDQVFHAASDPTGSGEDRSPMPDRAMMAKQQLAQVERALKALGERTDYIFRRHRIEEIPQRDIASELGISLSAVEKHLQKAYRAVRAVHDRLDGPASTRGADHD
jgi:RNA polymerase sigma factor (sigma-70 family)